MLQNLSSAAVMIGTLRVKIWDQFTYQIKNMKLNEPIGSSELLTSYFRDFHLWVYGSKINDP